LLNKLVAFSRILKAAGKIDLFSLNFGLFGFLTNLILFDGFSGGGEGHYLYENFAFYGVNVLWFHIWCVGVGGWEGKV